MDKYFFDIPVFRVSFEDWCREQDERKVEIDATFKKLSGTQDYDYTEMVKRTLREEFSSFYYSELVGMIRLFGINRQIRAELWFIQEKISKRLKKKTWHQASSKLFEYWINESLQNEAVFNWVCDKIETENKRGSLRNRFIDLKAFKNSGQYINYKELANIKS